MSVTATLGNPFLYGPRTSGIVRDCIRESDIVHVHGLYTYLNYIAGKHCRQLDRALVYHPHGALAPAFRRMGRLKKGVVSAAFERRNYAHLSAWRALTPHEGDHIRFVDSNAQVFVIPNGVSCPEMTATNPMHNRPRHLVNWHGERAFLFLSRMSNSKGIDILLSAWKQSGLDTPERSLWLAGVDRDGTANIARQQIQRLGLRNVTLIGEVTTGEKDWLLRESSVFVLPSRGEGQSPAALEAMAYGKPVLLTTACYFPEAIAAGAGVHCSPTADSLSQDLQRLARMRDDDLAGMGSRGRRYIRQNHDITSVAESLNRQSHSIVGTARMD